MIRFSRRNSIVIFSVVFPVVLIPFVINIYNLAGLLYTIVIPIAFFSSISIIGVAKIKLTKYNWYKEMTDKQYNKYLRVYHSYQNEVLDREKSYDIFVDEFYNSNLYIPIHTDSKGDILVDELNNENLHLSRVLNLLQNRRDLVEKYFRKENFDYNSYLSLMDDYNKTALSLVHDINENINNIKEKSVEEKIKEFVLTCYSPNGVKSLGDRSFGYFIKHRHPELSTSKQYLEAWNEYIGEDKPRDNCKYINDPSYWKNENEIPATLRSIEKIEIFYLGLMQDNSPIINSIQRDKKKLEMSQKQSQDQVNP